MTTTMTKSELAPATVHGWAGYGHPLPNSLRVYGPVTEGNVSAALALEWMHFVGTVRSFAERVKGLPPALRNAPEFRAALGEFCAALELLAPAMGRYLLEIRRPGSPCS